MDEHANGKGVVDETPTYNPVLSNEIITLKEENLKLKVDLDDAVNALFALQPRSQVPDTRIAKDYQQICRGVEVWVRAATSMLPPVGAFNTMYEYRLRTPETMPRHMMESLGPGDPVFLTGYRCSDFLVLSIIIQRFLDGIWVRKYPVGINRSDADFMDEIEVAMAEKLDKEAASIQGWRSETLAALIVTSRVKSNKQYEEQRLLEKAISILQPWLQKVNLKGLEPKFRQDILQPAINLLQDMRTSTNTYSMRMPTSLEKHWSLEKRLKEWEFKDIDTWSPLKADQALPGPGETFNSRLHPALYRSSTSDENCVKLVKPVIAIAMRERADEHRYDYSQWSKDDPVNYSEPAQRSSSRRTTSDRGRSRGSPSISKRNARGWFSGLTSTSGKRDARS